MVKGGVEGLANALATTFDTAIPIFCDTGDVKTCVASIHAS